MKRVLLTRKFGDTTITEPVGLPDTSEKLFTLDGDKLDISIDEFENVDDMVFFEDNQGLFAIEVENIVSVEVLS